jgi:hypothetical protein
MAKFKITSRTLVIGAVGFVALLVVAFGILRSQCPSAAERANAITIEDVRKQAEAYKRANALQALGRQLAATQPGSAEREAIVDAMIDTFDRPTQSRIRGLPSLGDRLDAIRMEIEKENAATVAETKAMQPHFWCR